jgi:hypothetical protein
MPLEKIKNSKKDETSKIMPSWMQIQIEKGKLRPDEMRSEKYNSIRNVIIMINFITLHRIKNTWSLLTKTLTTRTI